MNHVAEADASPRLMLAEADARPRLMIADDDPVVRMMLEMSLSADFNVVGVAEDGEQAIDLAASSRPDAALIDVEMPGGGGLHAVRGIHELAPETAIVVLSVDDSEGVVRRLVQEGATVYLRKGVGAQALTCALLDSIEVHASERHQQL
jgi:DNA-binding NarL/FixJ family response regulator